MDSGSNLIDKELVHKSSDNNVLIFNLRREIPHFIGAAEFKRIYKSSSPKQRELLDYCYTYTSAAHISFLNDAAEDQYMLKSMILEIDADEADRMADVLDVQDQAFLLLLYEPVCSTTRLRLLRDVTEEEEKHILKLMKLRDLQISEDVRYELSLLLEEFADSAKRDVVYSRMNVDINHDFFFEHPNDHVPGFMLIEAFRQFCVAVNHVYGAVPLSDAQLVLECLNSEFFRYAELSLPITLKGYIKECEWNRRGYWSYLDFESDIIQNGQILAHLRIYGKIISKGVFKRLRRIETDKLQRKYRYVLMKNISNRFELMNTENREYEQIKVVNFSLDGFMIETEYFTQENPSADFEFMFYFDQIGFIRGTCEPRWLSDDRTRAGMQITQIDNVSLTRLKTVLLKYCYVYDRDQMNT